MGMIANYQQTTDKELEAFKASEDLLEDIEKLQEDGDLEICDIDKMWDALHFLLTGKPASEPIEDDLISEAIVGQVNISGEDAEDFAAGIYSNRVHEIAEALKGIDFKGYIEKFNMSNFMQNDIYPNIWSYEEERDEIAADLSDSFVYLKNFYERMSEQGHAVLVSIY